MGFLKTMESKKFIIGVLAAAMSVLACTGIKAEAKNANEGTVLVYTDQEGMGHVTAKYRGQEFNYSRNVPKGDVIIASVQVYDRVAWDGWYQDGKLVTRSYTSEFKVNDDQTVIVAKIMNYAHEDKHEVMQKVSTYNWEGKTCRFVQPKDCNRTYTITTTMKMQGPACMESFEAGRGDFSLERTFNITFDRFGTIADKLPESDKLVFQIPSDLKAPGRQFAFIYVGKDGRPVVLADEDASDDTITFTGQYTGAYGLIMK